MSTLKVNDSQEATSGGGKAFVNRAWVKFNGTGTVSIGSDGNVTSITDNGTGLYTINFTNALADANHSTVGSCKEASLGYGDFVSFPLSGGTYSSTAVQIRTTRAWNDTQNLNIDADIANVQVAR